MISSVPAPIRFRRRSRQTRSIAVLLHVAGAAVDLQALVGDLAAIARRVQLGHRDLAHRVLAVREAPGGRVDELARGLDLASPSPRTCGG
jgi:hypothetical protein